jgi:hypothetical protein
MIEDIIEIYENDGYIVNLDDDGKETLGMSLGLLVAHGLEFDENLAHRVASKDSTLFMIDGYTEFILEFENIVIVRRDPKLLSI